MARAAGALITEADNRWFAGTLNKSSSVVDPEGVQGVHSNTPPQPHF